MGGSADRVRGVSELRELVPASAVNVPIRARRCQPEAPDLGPGDLQSVSGAQHQSGLVLTSLPKLRHPTERERHLAR